MVKHASFFNVETLSAQYNPKNQTLDRRPFGELPPEEKRQRQNAFLVSSDTHSTFAQSYKTFLCNLHIGVNYALE